MKKIKLLVLGVVVAIFMQSCYYDNVEELYPETPDCDTTNVSFSNDVWPVINSNCVSCHNDASPSGNISLSNYGNIVSVAQNGSLLGVIKHEDGWSPMPKGGGSLSDCNISKIETWVNAGTPDN